MLKEASPVVHWLLPLIVAQVCMTHATLIESKKPGVDYLEPQTFTDDLGNEVNARSEINFSNSSGKNIYPYNGGKKGDPVAISISAWFHDLSTSLARFAMDGSYPYETLEKVRNGKLKVAEGQKIATDHAALLVATAVGVAFIGLVPIACICFSYCRCAGRCGGKRNYGDPLEAGYKDTKNRIVVITCFTVPLTIAITGTVLMILANQSLTMGLRDFHDESQNSLNDVEIFFNNTIEEAEQVIIGKFNFITDVLMRDLENAGYVIGQPVWSRVNTVTRMTEKFEELLELEDDARTFVTLLKEVQSLKNDFDKRTKVIAEAFDQSQYKTYLQKATPSLKNFDDGTEFLNKMDTVEENKLPNFTLEIKALESFVKDGLMSTIEESRSALNDVPEKIMNQTKASIEEIKINFTSYLRDMEIIKKDLKTLRDDVLSGIDIDGLKKRSRDSLDPVLEYDNYRWYAGLVLAALALLVDILLLLAVTFGTFGGHAHVEPENRSGLSNKGGHLLLAGTILAFIVAWTLMLAATPAFLIGAPLDTVVCGPIRDLSLLDKLINKHDLLGLNYNGNGTWLGNQIFDGKGINLTLDSFMNECSAGGTIYTALRLDHTDFIDLNQLTDFNKTFDVYAELDRIQVDFSGTILDFSQLQQFILHMKTVETDIVHERLDKTIKNSPPSLQHEFKDHLIQKIEMTEHEETKKTLRMVEIQAKSFESELDIIDPDIEKLKSISKRFKSIINPPTGESLLEKCEKLMQFFKITSKDVSHTTRDVFRQEVKVFADRLTKIFSQGAGGLRKSVKSELGVCTPLFNIFDDLFVKSACVYSVGSFVAWACAMGMTSVFMIITICMTCRLSKHLYRMDIQKEVEGDSLPTPSAPPLYQVSDSNAEDWRVFKNQVYPYDSNNLSGDFNTNHRVPGGYLY